MEFSELLQQYLDEAGMSQADLAAKLGASRSSVGNLMRGLSREPSLHKAYAICKALEISLDEMTKTLYEDEES